MPLPTQNNPRKRSQNKQQHPRPEQQQPACTADRKQHQQLLFCHDSSIKTEDGPPHSRSTHNRKGTKTPLPQKTLPGTPTPLVKHTCRTVKST